MTIPLCFTKITITNFPWTYVFVPGKIPASLGGHVNFEVIPFGKNLHAQKIGTFPPRVKIKRPFG